MEVVWRGPGRGILTPGGRISANMGRWRCSLLLLIVVLLSDTLLTLTAAEGGCNLLGRGACRGDGWSAGEWPVVAGRGIDQDSCCSACQDKEGCTAFSLTKSGECFLFGHKKVVPASSLGGECYSVAKEASEPSAPKAGAGKPAGASSGSAPGKPAGGSSGSAPAAKPPPPPPPPAPAAKQPPPAKESSEEASKKPVKEEAKKPAAEKPKASGDDDDDKKKQPDPPKKAKDDGDDDKKKPAPADAKKPAPAEPAAKKTASAAAPAKKPAPAVVDKGPVMVGGKYVHLVGEGGCRGKNWNKAPWPVDAGRKNLAGCANLCLQQGCTAFHRLHHDGDEADCYLFGHQDLLAVRGLGGECHKLADNPPPPPKRSSSAQGQVYEEPEVEEEREVTGPVYMANIGVKGRCRGPNWTFKRWPKPQGLMSAQACAEKCARRAGCTAFDTSSPPEGVKVGPGESVCTLYGHAKVEAAPGVPGNCYALSDKPGQVIVSDSAGQLVQEEPEEEEEELEVTGEVDYHHLGRGRCRGPGWTSGKRWPAIRGQLIPKDCAVACAKKRGCVAFDIGLMAEGVEECALYGHKKVMPAVGVKGDCYMLGKSDQPEIAPEESQEEQEGEDDGVKYKFVHLGHGMCRGANWQTRKWPALRGMKNLQDCANSCGRTKGCTGFDISKPEGSEFDCMLYGHKHLVPAPGVPGECYSLVGAKYVEPEVKAAKPEPEQRSRAKILDESEEDYTNIKNVELLGKGACRGLGWQDGIWPIPKGRKSLETCAEDCKKTKGCVAFDISNKEKDKYDCLLLGHPEVLPASGLAAKCYVIKGAKPDPSTRRDSDKPKSGATVKSAKDTYPEGGFGFTKLGYGLCRGEGWQSKGWPMDQGEKSLKDCASACTNTRGCRAFDLARKEDSKLFGCLLFNHAKVTPASAVDGACYVPGGQLPEAAAEYVEEPEYVEESEEDVIIDLEGDLDVALLGSGGCRGAGWQEGGWPKVKGYVTVDQCGALCVSHPACTAFHVASPRESTDGKQKKDEYECFLFGHKSVVPASGLPGNCYTVAKGSSAVVKTAPSARVRPQKKEKVKKYKVPEFDPPTVVEDEIDPEDEEEWLFEPPPPEIRSRDHINQILGLNEAKNEDIHKVTEATLKELKKVYESSIKELEKLYKYKELSNRHFGDPEIFNKPLIVFMGPWSGGKSTIINYLLGIEYTASAFRSSAEPSPGFNFNLAMYGETEEEIDGTQLSAEWAFSSLQKFGQEFIKKIRGKKLPNKLLEKATFAEIPGVLETGTIRKVDRRYPFNDACQWFIDHADLIVLVYDYAKLDIGPETEALLDQLKGREQQVRIVLNKADEITAEELLKIQGNLVWNVSPLMASIEPPTLYAGSFWSKPYKNGAPKRLLKSQEQALIKDIRDAIDKRVENRIATARRFAVRVRNHAKMVDCYLTTFKNNKGLFGDKKKIAQDIIDNPGKYHIYEGLSALTNISRYDLPDPDTYRDFFNVHQLFEFPTLQSTCTFFKGCPLNKLDISIAYDLPDILTNYKKKISHIQAGGTLEEPAKGHGKASKPAVQPKKSAKM